MDTTMPEQGNGPAEGPRLDRFLDQALSVALAAPEALVSDVVSWHGHIPFAQALVATARPRLVVELGVHKGDSYRALVDAMSRYRIQGRAFGVDTWLGDAHAGDYAGDGVFNEVVERNTPYSGFSTLLRQTFDEARKTFSDGSVDLLHIDGLHTYEAVRHDFESWRPKLSAQGVVLFHDTAVREGDFGVHRLWEEISTDHLSYEFPHSNGLGILCLGDDLPAGTRLLVEMLREEAASGGVSPAQLFREIGDAFAGRISTRVFRDLYEAKEAEARSIQASSLAEIERLNAEIVEIRTEQKTAADLAELSQATSAMSDRLHDLGSELAQLQQASSAADLARLSQATSAMSDRLRDLGSEIAQLRQQASSAADLARLSHFIGTSMPATVAEEVVWRQGVPVAHRARLLMRRARDASMRAAQGGVRSAINALPVSDVARIRLKYRLVVRFGRFFGLAPHRAPFDTSCSAEAVLQNVSDRYLAISRTAIGAPAASPPRSVSIVVPVHNQLEYTLRCLDSIRRNSGDVDHEIIVVDDCSTDATPVELSRRDDILYIRNQENLGFIGSCNAGLARASGEYVLFLNNDTEVGPKWLSTLIDTFELHEHVGLVGSKLIYPDGSLQEAGGIVWDDFSAWNWGRTRDPLDPRFNYARQVDYCSGACLMLPRALALALDGFDPEFTPAYGEDSDLAFRIRTLGLSVLYQPLSQIIHHEGVSSGTDVRQGVKAHQVENAKRLAGRWAPVLPHQAPHGVHPELAADGGHVGRIFVIDQITPEPDRDAGSITALEHMRALRDFGYKITFVPCSNFCYIPDYSDTLAALGIESLHYPWSRSVREHLQEFGAHYDAVLIFRFVSAIAHLDDVRRHAPQARVIYHASDLHFLREERALQVDNSSIPERRHSARKTMQTELDLVTRTDLTITHSRYEKELLSTLAPDAKVVVFPWIYDPRGSGRPAAERRDLVFLGGYQHYPNVDAATFFASEVLPLLLRRDPGIVFHAVGSNPPPELEALAGPNFRVTGFVEDLSPILSGARIMVAPIRYGAGLKGKIVSALAHGLPVITTTIGAEGMGLTDGVDVLIANDPAEFAAAIGRLSSDDVLWTSLSDAGLEYVRRTTSSEAGYSVVRSILEKTGLPANARIGAPRSPYGSPRAVFDPASLAAAAANGPIPDGGLLVVPSSLAGIDVPGWTVRPVEECRSAAPRVVAIVDGTSESEVDDVLRALPRIVDADGLASVVFVPPRLVLENGRYRVLRPFAGDAVDAGVVPPHLRYGARLEKLGGRVSWRADRGLTGFPSVMIADWSRTV